MNSTVKTIIFWVFIFACLVLLWQVFQKSGGMGKDAEIAYSQFLQDAQRPDQRRDRVGQRGPRPYEGRQGRSSTPPFRPTIRDLYNVLARTRSR